jgi:hypothetical protein
VQRRGVPLSVRVGELALIIPEETAAVADGAHPLSFWAFALDASGRPLEGALRLTASEGSVYAQRLSPGTFAGAFTAPARAVAGHATLTAELERTRLAQIRVDLSPGMRPVLALTAPVQGLAADGVSATEMTLTVADQAGHPLPHQAVAVVATSGTTGPPEERAPGTFVFQYRTPAGGAGSAQVTATVPGAQPAQLTLALTLPPRLNLVAEPSQVPADGQSRVVLHISAHGPEGQALPDGTPVYLSTTRGRVPPWVALSGGRATAELVAGTQAGEARVEVRFEDAAVKGAVAFLPGAPARLTVRADRPLLYCDPKEIAELRMRLTDAHDNPLEAQVQLEQPAAEPRLAGTFETARSLGRGFFLATYHPPPACPSGPLPLHAVAVDGAGEQPLQIQWVERVAWTGWVGAGSGPSAAPYGQLELEADLPALGLRRLFWSASAALAAGALRAPWPQTPPTALSGALYAGPRWTFFDAPGWTAYLGGGLDGHLLWALGRARAGAGLGLHARAGLGRALGSGTLLLQVRYGVWGLWSSPDAREQALGPSASLGYRLPF